jgi:anhydro-N-acetylmuramic acid kinase
MNTTRWIIGLAPSAGCDTVEAAVLEVRGLGLGAAARVERWHAEPLAREIQDLLRGCSAPGQADVRQFALAHRVLGQAFAAAARQCADRGNVSLQNVLCAGCTGYAAWHESDGRAAATLTLGSPAFLAERTGLTTISDFRGRDQAAGGLGTLVSALADYVLFHSRDESRLVIHLGGTTRAVYLPAQGDPQAIQGWATGPGMVLLDGLIQELTGGKERSDAGGKLAVQGRQIAELLGRWMSHPFLMKRPPRLLHRSAFAGDFIRQAIVLAQQQQWTSHDLLCTANHLVAKAIGECVRRFPPRGPAPQRVLLTGAGTRNGLLWRLLEEQFPGATLEKSDACGIPAEAGEAARAGLMACFFLDGIPAGLPLVTGAAGTRLLGTLTPGSYANWSRCLAWMTGNTDPLAVEE